MIETTYRMRNPIDGDIQTTTVAVVADRYSRNGHRVTAVMEER